MIPKQQSLTKEINPKNHTNPLRNKYHHLVTSSYKFKSPHHHQKTTKPRKMGDERQKHKAQRFKPARLHREYDEAKGDN